MLFQTASTNHLPQPWKAQVGTLAHHSDTAMGGMSLLPEEVSVLATALLPVQETEMIVADHFCECLCFPKHLALSSSPRHLMPTNGTHHKTQNLNNQLLTNLEEDSSDLL
jgi:hypothetical protein